MQQTLTQYEVEYNAKADEFDALVEQMKAKDSKMAEIESICQNYKQEVTLYKDKT